MDVKNLLNGNDEGEWCSVLGTDDVEIKIRRLKPKEFDSIRKASQSRRKGYRARLRQDDLDDKMMIKCLDEMVLEWKGLASDGQPWPCTKENKILLDGNWMPFRQLWQDILLESMDEEAEDAEELVKN